MPHARRSRQPAVALCFEPRRRSCDSLPRAARRVSYLVRLVLPFLRLRTPRRRRWLTCGVLAPVAFLAFGLVATSALVARAERNFPPRGRFVPVRDARLHVIERGQGAPIVLIHGAFGAANDWDVIAEALAKTHRVLAFDRPAHGYSDALEPCDGDPREQARALIEAWRALGVEHPTVAGFSYGGTVALAAALESQSDVGALVTINAPIHSWGGTFHPAYELIDLSLLGPLFTHTWATPIATITSSTSIAGAFAPLPVPAEFARSPIALAIRPRSLAANARDINKTDAFLREQEPHYHELALPIVIVVSEGDQVVTPSIHAHALASELADTELISIDGAGHQLLYTHPARVVDAIERASGRALR